MALDYSFAKKAPVDDDKKGAPSAAEEPKEERPVNDTGQDKDTFWIDEVMIVKQGLDDLSEVKAMFGKIHEFVDQLEADAKAFKVIDKETMELAIGKGTQAKQWANKIEKRRKEVKAPYLAFTKRLDTLTKGVIDRFEAIQEGLREKIRPVMRELKAKEEAARAAELKAQAEAAAKAMAKAKDTGEEPAPPPPAAAPPAPASKVSTSTGSAKLEKTFEWDVTDITKVPKEYLSVVPSKVNTFVKANLKLDKEVEIPGIKITYKEDVAMRAAKS